MRYWEDIRPGDVLEVGPVEVREDEIVAFGSDFDGAVVPAALGGVSGLPRLVDALRDRFEPDEVDRITHGNWLRVLDATWR